MVQGNFVIGLVIFIILTIINFIVITKGAGRVAEVSARFTLDAMPGKQMSHRCRPQRRHHLRARGARPPSRPSKSEADFYGAMDGASKFVRGDAMAGILITGINLDGRLCHRHRADESQCAGIGAAFLAPERPVTASSPRFLPC